jgi:hypothetical protein
MAKLGGGGLADRSDDVPNSMGQCGRSHSHVLAKIRRKPSLQLLQPTGRRLLLEACQRGRRREDAEDPKKEERMQAKGKRNQVKA